MHNDPTPTSGAAARETADTAGGLPVVYCPECGMPAWVEWRDVVGSPAGAVAHVKVRCFARHWFLMLEDGLTER